MSAPAPTSFSAIERNNPPPRRKSCFACTKAKRRCDLGSPACLRCAQRKLDCRYPSSPTNQAGSASNRRARNGTPIRAEKATHPPKLTSVETVWEDLGLLNPTVTYDVTDSSLFTPSSISDSEQAFADFVRTPVPETVDFPALDQDLSSTSDDSLAPFMLSFNPDLSRCLEFIPPSPLAVAHPRSKKHTIEIINAAVNTRLHYALEQIQLAPQYMVMDTETPWSHPLLYRNSMPRSMQDAHACCGLHLAINDRNRGVIIRSIHARYQDLTATPLVDSPMELLARTQALLLYQIMTFFNADPSSRSLSLANTTPLEEAAMAMIKHTKFHGNSSQTLLEELQELPLYPLDDTRDFWNSWIFQESARRSVMMALFCLQLMRLLTGNVPMQCDARLYLAHSWTASSYLWDAKDPIMFATAWKEKKHLVVTPPTFSTLLDEAEGDDVGSFAKILLTTFMGVDEARGWLLTRGGQL